MKTDIQHKIDGLRESENGTVLDAHECHERGFTVYCCNEQQTPKHALQFPNEDIWYFVCPNCGDF